ncbi:MAG TPA: hypothetical protein V6D07_08615 [Trichocoleus sp.]
MLKSANKTASQVSLESIVRQALAVGELSPEAENSIRQVCASGKLAADDKRILEILEDAIANNCIKRTGY